MNSYLYVEWSLNLIKKNIKYFNMKKILFIITLLLLSCGKSGPSACDCAEMAKLRIEGKMETLTKTIEEQNEIEVEWEKKLNPCKVETEKDGGFEKKVQDCLLNLFQSENEKELEKNQ